jgi:hypothetical protein
LTTDPFNKLQHQLESVVARRHRGRRRMRLSAFAVIATMTATAGVAAAGGFRGGPSAAERAIRAADDLVANVPACTPRPTASPRLVSGSPDPRLLRSFRVFRRARGPADRVDSRMLTLGGRDVLRSSVRTATATDGTRVVVFVSRGPGNFKSSPADPLACSLAARAAGLAGVHDPAVRAQVRNRMDDRVQRARDLVAGRSQYLTIAYLTDSGRFADFSSRIIDGSALPATAPARISRASRRTTVAIPGLVPDSVHDLRLVDGRAGRSSVIPARDNVIHGRLTRTVGPHPVAQLRNATGAVIRVQHIAP